MQSWGGEHILGAGDSLSEGPEGKPECARGEFIVLELRRYLKGQRTPAHLTSVDSRF